VQLAGKMVLPLKISSSPAITVSPAAILTPKATVVYTVSSRNVASKWVFVKSMSSGTLDKIYLTKRSQIGVP